MKTIFIALAACAILHDLSRTLEQKSQDMKNRIHAVLSEYLEQAYRCSELTAYAFFNTHYAFKAQPLTKGVDFRPAVAKRHILHLID